MTLGAGQGKTLVFLLVLQILNLHDSLAFNSFLILVPNQILKEQLELIIQQHDIDLEISVQYELSYSEHVSNLCCIVMDEADFLIRLNAIVHDEEKKQLLGLLQLKGKNFLMCSATYSPLEKEILKWCVKIPSDQIFEYLNTNTIVQKRVKNVDPVTLIKKIVWQNKDEVKHRLLQFVEMHRASPIIVFMEKQDSESTKLL